MNQYQVNYSSRRTGERVDGENYRPNWNIVNNSLYVNLTEVNPQNGPITTIVDQDFHPSNLEPQEVERRIAEERGSRPA